MLCDVCCLFAILSLPARSSEHVTAVQHFVHANRWRLQQVLHRAAQGNAQCSIELGLMCDILACAGGISAFNPTPLLASTCDYQGNLRPLSPAQLRLAVAKILGYKRDVVNYQDLLSQRVVCCVDACVHM